MEVSQQAVNIAGEKLLPTLPQPLASETSPVERFSPCHLLGPNCPCREGQHSEESPLALCTRGKAWRSQRISCLLCCASACTSAPQTSHVLPHYFTTRQRDHSWTHQYPAQLWSSAQEAALPKFRFHRAGINAREEEIYIWKQSGSAWRKHWFSSQRRIKVRDNYISPIIWQVRMTSGTSWI